MKNNKLPDKYITALKIPWLTSLYDPIVRWTTRESRVKGALIAQAELEAKMKVLDLASGTGTLSLMIKQRFPCVDVEGIDGDPKILQIAQAKSDRVGLDVKFEQGLATKLPYADFSIDRVFSTLFFHHLDIDDKHLVFTEIYRVLKPDGQLHIADWGKPTSGLMRLLFYPIQWLDGFSNTQDNVEGRLPELIQNAGFSDVQINKEFSTVFGTLTIYCTSK